MAKGKGSERNRACGRLLWLPLLLILVSCQSPVSLRERPRAAHEDVRTWLERAAAASDAGDAVALRQATGEFAAAWHASRPRELPGFRIQAPAASRDIWDPVYFDRLRPADDLELRGLNGRHVRPGAGAPLVGWRENRGQTPIERHFPPEGISRPVTAWLAFGPKPATSRGSREVKLWLLDSTRVEHFRGQPVAADFSAPWAALLAHAGPLQRTSFSGLTHADRSRQAGLYLMEPYDPGKTPLLMVHGLLSTPLTWMELTHSLWADPAVRRRYQIWHYLYPTGLPFLYSAKIFREQLAETRRLLDPTGRDPAMQRTVVIGHSMGGLLTKTLVTTSGEKIWNAAFSMPASALHGSAADRSSVADSLHWRAQAHVRRVIFVAVPHRGSSLATSFAGWVGKLLTHVPRDFVAVYARLNSENPGALREVVRQALIRGRLSSIATLSPRHLILPVMASLPFAPWVQIHSIIGDRGRPGPLAKSSDGVVPYTSSHLDGVASELVVPADHGAFRHPAAVREILRILALP